MKSKLEGATATSTATKRRVPTIQVPIERFALDCGAVLLVSRREGAPVTAVQAHLRGGPSLDSLGKEGTAYLCGTLADQGTKKHSEAELAAILEPAGGELSGDATGLAGTIVKDQSELLFELIAEILTSATFPKAQVARHKGRLLDRLLVERDDPRVKGGHLFRKLVYGAHWLGRTAYGTSESVAKITAADLRAHHAANWVAKRTLFAVCGDVDPERVKKLVNKLLRKWKPGGELVTSPPKLPARGVRVQAFHASREQVHLYLGHLGIKRDDPDYAALTVMDHVLGTGPGFTNRISRKLRDELGLAYAVNATIHASAGLLPGMFTAYIGTSPKHVKTALAGFVAEIRRIQREPVSEEELGLAKSYLIGSFPLGFERASRRSSYMISAELFRFPPDNLERLLASFAAVTSADVQRVARKHLHPEESCLAASGPVTKAELADALASALQT